MRDSAKSYAKSRNEQFIADLMELVRIPSVSIDPAYREGVLSAADWIMRRLCRLGFASTRLIPSDENPIIIGSLHNQERLRTILVYGHYDVMPAEPTAPWRSPPFEPTIKGEYVYGRGSSDMKGQLIAFLSALESLLNASTVPVNIVVLFEGAEEAGSPGLETVLKKYQRALECDFCLILDGGIHSSELPSITCATRGLAYFDLSIRGAASDLHSGRFGGPIENPALVMCELIAQMRDKAGKVLISGFYDDVRSPGWGERGGLDLLTVSEEWWKSQAGVRRLRSEAGYSATELATTRPTLNVDGLLSGYSGLGEKTIIPSEASAKISMRLVPDQTPEGVHKGLLSFLSQNAPPTVEWSLRQLPGCLPSILDPMAKQTLAASRALESTWGVSPVLVREGGALPVISYLSDALGVESTVMGFGLPDDNIHASNERQHLPTFGRGIEAYINFLCEVARMGQ